MANSAVGTIIGPTASGKSQLALEVNERLGGEVISADAYQIYRGLDVGTGKISAEQRRGIRHHLIDAVPADQALSVAEFQELGRAAIADCHRRHVLPVVAGGSALYVRALIDDFEFPGTDIDVRKRWQAELDRLGPEALHGILAQRDQHAAEHILPSNGRRIVRALEVGELTGRGFSPRLPAFHSIYDEVRAVGIRIDRQTLDTRIADRVTKMWNAGWVAEVQDLIGRGFAKWPTASRALGYREVMAYIEGDMDRDTAIQAITAATRRFARRQQRVFARDPRIIWLDFDDDDLVDRACEIMLRQRTSDGRLES